METIITAATVLSMFMNLSNDVNAPYYYNADVENNQVKTLYVYNDNDGQLSARLSYHYTYDEEGRLKSKVAYRYDSEDNREKPSYRLDFHYAADGYSVERSEWNADKKCFDTAHSRLEYVSAMENLMAVTNYERSEELETMQKKESFLVWGNHDDFLLACK